MTREKLTSAYQAIAPFLNERFKRLLAAMLARSYGLGGVALVHEATGVARSTIERGLTELEQWERGEELDGNRIRRPGGGRKRVTDTDPELDAALRALVDPVTRGDPESPLIWVAKSTRALAATLREQGHQLSHETVRQWLLQQGFTLQSTRKSAEGKQHPDRNAQFEYLAQQVQKFLQAEQPVISVDTKKKELVGNYANAGREWQPKGEPVAVQVHDFPDPELGKAVPYGVYDVGADEGWVSVGISHDTAEFATATIRSWWREMGRERYPEARHLLITADGGGSNSVRGRLWKTCLQELADELDLRIWVCHYPPGTSKWNKIEHRMFSRITQNWRGRPLQSVEVIVNLIAHTRLGGGTRLRAARDEREYPKGKKVSDAELEAVRLLPQTFHPEWNYVIVPRSELPNWTDDREALVT